MKRASDLRIKIFADGADLDGMLKMTKNPFVKGFTTNPTLMRKAGVTDYEAFARKVLQAIPDRPVPCHGNIPGASSRPIPWRWPSSPKS